ncbi:MAG: hypothetical protein HC901_00340 [Bdellovibrionaceae bacterium]|nr:hypothetical protein [Pseudobdellovibrionaceae bacterium]
MPFEEAMQSLARRDVLPSALTSAQQRQQFAAGFHRQNFTSAQTLLTDLLDGYKEKIGSILNPTTQQRADRVTETNPEGNVSTGLDVPTARLEIKQLLQKIGYQPGEGKAGTIQDLASDARINLVFQTNKDVMQGAGQFVQSQDEQVLVAFPAWELIRVEARKQERDWAQRWQMCARIVGDVGAARVLDTTGRMMARKDSAIWQALGDGMDGSDDTLGNPFPPFAFNSGMDVRDIAWSEAVELEIIQPGDTIAPRLPADLSQLFRAA